MSVMRARLFLIVLFAIAAASCWGDPAAITGLGTVEIRLRTSGGFTGFSSTVLLDGTSGQLVGVACSGTCSFTPGDVLVTLPRKDLADLVNRFHDAGIRSLDGTDFGVECCDQMYVELWYSDLAGSSAVQGTLSRFPPTLAQAVTSLRGWVPHLSPVLIDFNGDPSDWPRAPLAIQNPVVSGDVLSVSVSFSGGCREHEIQAVAWGGWMQSSPPQVRVFLAHDDHGDACEAWITEALRFGLGPLKDAYRDAFGSAPPGWTTIRVLLEDPRLANPLGAWVLHYTF
jgi:hypothetical protein